MEGVMLVHSIVQFVLVVGGGGVQREKRVGRGCGLMLQRVRKWISGLKNTQAWIKGTLTSM